MTTYRMYLNGTGRSGRAVNESGEPSLGELPWTIYVETDALDPLFQKFQRDHAKFLKDWMKKNIQKE